jgi:hypothetical protein
MHDNNLILMCKQGIISPSKSSVHLELPTKEQNTHQPKHHQQLTPTRKSPKRRPIPKYPVVSSSSSTESITSAKEILPRGSKSELSMFHVQ